MKELIIYFGKKNESPLGWGATADTIKCTVPNEEVTIHELTKEKWVFISLPNGTRYINTENILWFDIVEKEQS